MPTTLERIHDVEIFGTGQVNVGGGGVDDRAYTLSDLQEMADNWHLLSSGDAPVLKCPVTIGHAADGEEKPAVAWMADVRVAGDRLLCDFVDLDPDTAEQIRNKNWKNCSIECYPEFTAPDGNTYKNVLRGVAILGSSQPAKKGMADIPMPKKFSDRRGVFCRFARPMRFSEAPTTAEPDMRLLKVVIEREIMRVLGPAPEPKQFAEAPTMQLDDEIEFIKQYHAGNREQFFKTRTTADQLVRAFRAMRGDRQHRGLTAREFLGLK